MSDNLYEDIDCGTDAHPLFVTDYVCQGKLGFKEPFVSTYLFPFHLFFGHFLPLCHWPKLFTIVKDTLKSTKEEN